jgi:salicylate hydroxylase
LQRALINQVPAGIIQLRKELVSIENIPEGGANLNFSDGTQVFADLVVGGDGIRSVSSHLRKVFWKGLQFNDEEYRS